MILHGDEMGRTQQGNNNVYAQDNELAWVDWELAKDNWALVEFTAKVAKLRHENPVFKRRRFFSGTSLRGTGGVADIVWFTPAGTEMSDEDWDSGFAKSLGVFLNGKAIRSPDSRGEPVVGDSFLLLFNAYEGPVEFTAPPEEFAESWLVEIDTATPIEDDERIAQARGEPDGRGQVAGRAAEAVLDAGTRGALPIPDQRRLHPRRRGGAGAVPPGAGGDPRLPVAAAAGRARVDARLRRGGSRPDQ